VGAVILNYCSSVPQTCMTSAAEEDFIYASSLSAGLGEQEVISHSAAAVYHSLLLSIYLAICNSKYNCHLSFLMDILFHKRRWSTPETGHERSLCPPFTSCIQL